VVIKVGRQVGERKVGQGYKYPFGGLGTHS